MTDTYVLVDSSAWIEFFNRPQGPYAAVVSDLLRNDAVAICGPILTEVLRGARTAKERATIEGYFRLLHYFDLGKSDFIEAASIGFMLARKGVTAASVDLLIAHIALRERAIVLHRDRDFEGIARYLALRTHSNLGPKG